MQNKYKVRELIGANEKPIIFEIGSADGLDTLKFIEAFNDLDFDIYCFEPDLRNLKVFKETVHDPRVHLFEGVIGDTTGKRTFYTSTKSFVTGQELIYSSSLRRPGKDIYKIWPNLFQSEANFSPTTVNSMTLDDFIEQNNIPYISYIYADVQGCEDLMILGGKNAFVDKVKYLYTEYDNRECYIGEPNLEKILSLLPNYDIIKDFKTDILLRNVNLTERKDILL